MAVLEAVLPRVEQKLDDHMESTRRQNVTADASRKDLHDAIQDVKDNMQKVKDALDAKDNQAKGFIWAWELARTAVLFIVAVIGAKWSGILK